MPTTELRSFDHAMGDGSSGARAAAYAFGLQLELPLSLGIALASGGGAGSPRTQIVQADRQGIERAWKEAGPHEHLLARRFANGRPMMTIDHAPRLGYRIWAPRHGRHLVSSDGFCIHAAPRFSSNWNWQRLLFAQVLPLAAALQGLEPLHASAVARFGHVVGFTAASGTGKTSIAAHLIARGARLVADDVLVVESTATGPVAHPAGGLIGVTEEQYAQLTVEGRRRLGERVGGAGKIFTLGEPCKQPLPLLALFVLERHAGVQALSIQRLESPDPRMLLSSSFINYVRDGRRLRHHLDVCAKLAASVAIYRLRIPVTGRAGDVAAVVDDFIDGLISERC